MRCKAWIGVATAVLMVVAAACGGNDTDSGNTAERMSTVAQATETEHETLATDDETQHSEETIAPGRPTREEEVLAAYQAAMEAVVAAYDPADPEHPDLLATYAGDSLARHQESLAEYQKEGLSLVATSKEEHPEQVISIEGDTAVVEDCIVEVLETLDPETREPQGEPRHDTLHVRRRMRRIDGTWKIVRGKPLSESCPSR